MRIQQLTFTRFVAAVLIVIYHRGKDSYLFNNEYLSFIFTQANIGVSYFFVLSGFVMIVAYNNKEHIIYLDYIKNRLSRIYPVYILAIFLILCVKLFKEINYYDLMLNVLMIQSWVPGKDTTINGPGWSLSTEMFFYLCFPLLFNFIYKKLTLKNVGFWVILFWFCSQIVIHLLSQNLIRASINSYSNPFMRLNEFLVGNLAGLFFINKLQEKRKNYSVYILVALLTLVLLLKFPIGLNYQSGLLSILFAPLIILLSLSTDKLTKLFSTDIFIFLGEISFGIYILQVPIWWIFSDYRMNKYFRIDKESDFTLSFFVRLLVLIIISSLSYLYFEKPIKNKINNLSLK